MEPTVKIGFFGCGNVGSGVWKLLNGFSKELTDRVEDLLYVPEISLILEFLGG